MFLNLSVHFKRKGIFWNLKKGSVDYKKFANVLKVLKNE